MSDLSNVGTADFQIAFTIRTTQKDHTIAIANQRGACGAGDFWDVRLVAGAVDIALDDVNDGGDFASEAAGCTPINDGTIHDVVIQRIAGALAIYVDGKTDAAASSATPLQSLPALAVRNDVCIGVDGTAPFDSAQGTVAAFCITKSPTPAAADAGATPCL